VVDLSQVSGKLEIDDLMAALRRIGRGDGNQRNGKL
jgi:hypothetical protein